MVSDIERTLIGLEQESWQANINEDVEYFRQHTTDNILIVASFGVFDKRAIIGQLEKKQGVPYKSARMENPRAITLTEGCALITYKVTIEARVQGKVIAIPRFVTTVYVKQDGGWKSAFMQQTDTK